jgi:hypothetical protein
MRRLFVGLAISFATLTPTWALANDQQIAQQIIQKLEQQKQAGQLKGFGIELKVEEGTVFMNGRVATPEQQQLALGIAQRTAGVKEVVNGVTITGATAAATPASSTASAAKASQSSMLSKWGGGVKQAANSEASPGNVQQVANVETVPQQSVMKRATVKPVPSYTTETGSGVRQIPTSSRIQQSQLVAGQEAPGYAMPVAPQQMSPRALQSQMQGQHPGATMPGHTGPGRPMYNQGPQPMARTAGYAQGGPAPYGAGGPIPAQVPSGVGIAPARYDHPQMPGYAWPSYASYPNYSAVTYPKQYSPTAWPYIGPFYPYPQVPLGWRKVTLEWDDGWWMLDFKDQSRAWKPHR